jgi:hypothetical protein
VGFEENDIRARAAYGGEHFWLFRVADRISFGEDTSLALSGGYESRPDQPYHGIGGRERQSPQPAAFYQRELSDGRLELSSRWFRSSKFSAAVGVASMKTNGNVSCCGEPTIAERLVRAPQVAVPQGLGQRYTTMFAEGDVSFDTRPPRLPDTEPAQDTPPVSGSGFRLDLRGRYSYQLDRGTLSDPDADTHQRWVTYGSTLSGFVDVSSERVVGLSVITDFVDPLGDETELPFTELVTLGGFRPLPGFLQGRLRDRSSAVFDFEYTWPVWVWLDGSLHYSVGNVFESHLSNLRIQDLRSSFGLGLKTVGERDHSLQMILAAGTEPFSDGGSVQSLRFMLGTPTGF